MATETPIPSHDRLDSEVPPADLPLRIKALVDRIPPDRLEELYRQCLRYVEGNLRASERIPFFVEAAYTHGEVYRKDFVRDLGAGGLFLETDTTFSVGTTVTLFVDLPGMKGPAALPGVVVRKAENGVGIQFIHSPAFVRHFLPRPVKGFEGIRVRIAAALKEALRTALPARLSAETKARWLNLRWLAFPALRRLHAGHSHWCPVCESSVRRFLPYLDPPIPNARCPVCRSLERHRLDWLFLKKRTDLLDPSPKALLHIAPERIFRRKLESAKQLRYVTGDLMDPSVHTRLDVTRLPFRDGAFDAVYCSHVLEHVPNDTLAMAELFRVLRPGRWAVIQVPVTAKRTFEDPSIRTPEERKRWFGQADHVRRYGPDVVERLQAAGFQVRVVPASDLIESPGDFVRLGIQPNRFVLYCTKPSIHQPETPAHEPARPDRGRT